MKKFAPTLLAVCLSLGMAGTAFATSDVVITPFKNMPADFIKGADISTLAEMESQGANSITSRVSTRCHRYFKT